MREGPADLRPAGGNDIAPKELKNFVQLNLVGNNTSDKPLHIDPDLVNAWGISFPPSGPDGVAPLGTSSSGSLPSNALGHPT